MVGTDRRNITHVISLVALGGALVLSACTSEAPAKRVGSPLELALAQPPDWSA